MCVTLDCPQRGEEEHRFVNTLRGHLEMGGHGGAQPLAGQPLPAVPRPRVLGHSVPRAPVSESLGRKEGG